MEGGPTTNDTRHPATVQRVRQPLTLDACRVCDTVLRLIPNYLGGAAFHVGVTRLFSGYCMLLPLCPLESKKASWS